MTSVEYSTGLLSCCSDIGICCCGMFCPPCLKAKTWAHFRQEKCSLWHFCYSNSAFWNRQYIKSAYGIEQNYLGDCLILCCCYQCALCQDAREIKYRHKYEGQTLIQSDSKVYTQFYT